MLILKRERKKIGFFTYHGGTWILNSQQSSFDLPLIQFWNSEATCPQGRRGSSGTLFCRFFPRSRRLLPTSPVGFCGDHLRNPDFSDTHQYRHVERSGTKAETRMETKDLQTGWTFFTSKVKEKMGCWPNADRLNPQA